MPEEISNHQSNRPVQAPIPLSVFIIAYNEADRIPATIKSVKDWVDEVIVIDSGSQDETVALCKQLGATVIEQSWVGYGPQKRFAEEQCRNKWVLNLDADEIVTPSLAQEIQSLFRSASLQPEQAFRLRICDTYPHQQQPCRWPFTYNPVRLYHLDQGRYANHPIHDRVNLQSNTACTTLRGQIHHRSIRNLSHLTEKANQYTDMQAKYFCEQGRTISAWRLVFEFPINFCKSYFFKGNILRGWYGVILSLHYAYFRFLRMAKIWEKTQKFKSLPPQRRKK